MKITVEGLRQMVREQIAEAAKKKKKKGLTLETEVKPDGHLPAERALDLSPPLGGLNTYRQQGQANFGPYTGDMESVVQGALGMDYRTPLYGSKLSEETALRSAVRNMISEELRPDPASAWSAFAPPPAPRGIWESAMRYYDFQMRGLGQVKEQAELPKCPDCGRRHSGKCAEKPVDEKKIGFKKMKRKLAHKKGVKNPGGLAHYIDVQKYGPGGHKAHPRKKG